jgi:hypothetical protein
MTRLELLKQVREIYAEVETLKIPKNEKSKNGTRKQISEMDSQSVKDGKVQN